MRVLVTGATGFVGRTLVKDLLSRNCEVVAAVRGAASDSESVAGLSSFVTGDLLDFNRWDQVVQGVHAVVHLAARVHVMNETAEGVAERYRRSNVVVTEQLMTAAAGSGCRKFVFLSSIKVNGERTLQAPFVPTDPAEPLDPYGMSKLEAETALMRLAQRTGMDAVVVRSPLVYGPGVGGNFLRFMNLVAGRYWLPFGSIDNRRSLVSVRNLSDFICHSLMSERASPLPALISDGTDLSTPDLIREIAAAMQVRPKLLRVPPTMLKIAGAISGFKSEIDRLCDSLQVDPLPTMMAWNWRPRFSMSESMVETARWYLDRRA